MAIYFDNEPNDKNTVMISGFSEGRRKIWITTEQWFHPIIIDNNYKNSDLPSEIVLRVEKYREYARNYSFQPFYYIKYASVRFFYKGEFYRLTTSALDINNELFDEISNYIERDLKSMGAEFTDYTGMMD